MVSTAEQRLLDAMRRRVEAAERRADVLMRERNALVRERDALSQKTVRQARQIDRLLAALAFWPTKGGA